MILQDYTAITLLVTAPIIWSALSSWRLLALALLAGTLVDVDHFLAVGSGSFQAATHLPRRPPTHSVTSALLVSGDGYLLSGSLTTAWVVFAALTSHLLRDAPMGTTPLLWPLGKLRIPRWAHYLSQVRLLLASHWAGRGIGRDF